MAMAAAILFSILRTYIVQYKCSGERTSTFNIEYFIYRKKRPGISDSSVRLGLAHGGY